MMRRFLGLMAALVLLAGACAGTDSGAVENGAEQVTGENPSSSDPADDAQDGGDPDLGSDDQPAAPAVCGFGQGLDADRIEVPQIPGDGRDNTVSALDFPADDSFGPELVDLNRILSGGPPPDGIPPIDAPVFQTAGTVDWIQCNEPVLALTVEGETRAYPVQIMTWHELVNDTFGSVPVTVSYCPLCNSALAYRRDLSDRVVTFGTSGRLFNSSLVMYDRETESLWTHFDGTAVVGALVGTELELLPIQTLSWQSFLAANPDGLVLTRETGHERNYGRNPYSGYDNVETDPFLFDGEADPRLRAKERIVAIRRNDDSVAVVLESLAEAGVLQVEVGGEALSVWHRPGTATALEQASIADGRDIGAVGVYVPVVDGQALTFERTDEAEAEEAAFVDVETGSTWNVQGRATSGQLAGTELDAVEHLDTFWFALAAFEPDTRVVNS